ncbi:MAG: LysR substrate-binding domain-containing protein [Pseudomonadota bacterium]
MNPVDLPPLNSLRALEAVARHRSFKRAAEELFVTPAAITHQIKQLEERLGIQLFKRTSQRISLTSEAEAALPLLQKGFATLAQAVAELHTQKPTPQLTVGTSPTFASRWLMPRLREFLLAHPGIDVRVSANSRTSEPNEAKTRRKKNTSRNATPDIDIVFTSEELAGPQAHRLFRVEVLPMCHPQLLQGPTPLQTPSDLRHQTLLHGDGLNADRTNSTWARWLRDVGAMDVDARRGLQFEHSTLALDAAADGLGVILASPLLAAAEMSAGKVVIAMQHRLLLDNAYYVIASETALSRPEVSAFNTWLLEKARTQAI